MFEKVNISTIWPQSEYLEKKTRSWSAHLCKTMMPLCKRVRYSVYWIKTVTNSRVTGAIYLGCARDIYVFSKDIKTKERCHQKALSWQCQVYQRLLPNTSHASSFLTCAMVVPFARQRETCVRKNVVFSMTSLSIRSFIIYYSMFH